MLPSRDRSNAGARQHDRISSGRTRDGPVAVGEGTQLGRVIGMFRVRDSQAARAGKEGRPVHVPDANRITPEMGMTSSCLEGRECRHGFRAILRRMQQSAE